MKWIWLGYTEMKAGILFRFASFWVGVHYSRIHKRVCINLLPCVTIWVTLKDGDIPHAD